MIQHDYSYLYLNSILHTYSLKIVSPIFMQHQEVDGRGQGIEVDDRLIPPTSVGLSSSTNVLTELYLFL